jgi:hypothetical protein
VVPFRCDLSYLVRHPSLPGCAPPDGILTKRMLEVAQDLSGSNFPGRASLPDITATLMLHVCAFWARVAASEQPMHRR